MPDLSYLILRGRILQHQQKHQHFHGAPHFICDVRNPLEEKLATLSRIKSRRWSSATTLDAFLPLKCFFCQAWGWTSVCTPLGSGHHFQKWEGSPPQDGRLGLITILPPPPLLLLTTTTTTTNKTGSGLNIHLNFGGDEFVRVVAAWGGAIIHTIISDKTSPADYHLWWSIIILHSGIYARFPWRF